MIGKVGDVADWDATSAPPLLLMNWADLRSLEARGFQIGSHATAHVDLTTLTDDEIARDSREARIILRRQLGHDVTSIAFPWGVSNARSRAALARSGYRVGVEVAAFRSSLWDEIGCLPRIEILADDDIASFADKLQHGEVATSAADAQLLTPAKYCVYVAPAMRRSRYRVGAESGFFQFRGNDLFLHPPKAGRSRIHASDIAPGGVGAVFGCVLSLDRSCARRVRFRVQLADRMQSAAREAVIEPGERREISLVVEGFDGPLSIELTTEMAGGSGSNSASPTSNTCPVSPSAPAPGAVSLARQGC